MRHVVEHLQQFCVARRRLEVLLQHAVDLALQHQTVVDGVHLDLVVLVPARLAAASHRFVHDVVPHEERRLQPLDAPAHHLRLEHQFRVDLGSVLRERAHAVDHRQTAVELAVGDVVLHHLVDPVGGDLHLPIGFLVVHELLAELLEHLQERLVLVAGKRTCQRVVRGCAREKARERVEASPERVDGTRADARLSSVGSRRRPSRAIAAARAVRPPRETRRRSNPRQSAGSSSAVPSCRQPWCLSGVRRRGSATAMARR